MPATDRERALVDALAEVADGLVLGEDVADLLDLLVHRCRALFPVAATGLLLRGADGLGLAATSSEQVRLLEFLQLRDEEGACIHAYQTGEPVLVDDLAETTDQWPTWAPQALELGFRSVTSLPLRVRDETIGAMNLFGQERGALGPDDLAAAQALARLATAGILQQRALRDAETLASQLQTALDSRVVIEQAKGVLSVRYDVGLEAAFEMLRSQARREKRKIGTVAREVIDGALVPRG